MKFPYKETKKTNKLPQVAIQTLKALNNRDKIACSVNPNLYGGGGANLPQAVFCYSSKTVGARLLKLCGFYC